MKILYGLILVLFVSYGNATGLVIRDNALKQGEILNARYDKKTGENFFIVRYNQYIYECRIKGLYHNCLFIEWKDILDE